MKNRDYISLPDDVKIFGSFQPAREIIRARLNQHIIPGRGNRSQKRIRATIKRMSDSGDVLNPEYVRLAHALRF